MNNTHILSEQQSPLVIEPGSNPDYAIIWLHGLGASGHDLAPLSNELSVSKNLSIRHIFPHAPNRPVTLNNGYVMPAWYDIKGINLHDREDEQGILASQQYIQALILEQQTAGLNSNQVILAGFSQGGAMALYSALHYSGQLAGVIALSCYLPLASKLQVPLALESQTPFFFAAGQQDPIVNIQWSLHSKQALMQLGFTNLTWRDYPMEHSICLEELQDISEWLNGIFHSSPMSRQ